MTAWLFVPALLLALSQAPAVPAPSTAASDPTATSIRGVVVDATTRAPVRRARIRAASLAHAAETVTDAEGRFEIRNLPRGSFTVSASKPGYLSTQYGQAHHGGPGVRLTIPADGDHPLRLEMPRGGVIAGRVVDDHGEPVLLAEVLALQYRYDRGPRRLGWTALEGTRTQTDDLGTFRLYNLPPGKYYLAARATNVFNVVAPGPLPADYRVPTTTFFPNTTDAANALPMTVVAGKELTSVSITVGSTRVGRIRGRAVTSSGDPYAYGFVQLKPRDDFSMLYTAGGPVREDGTFDLQRVPAGAYELTVSRQAPATADAEVGRAAVTVAADGIEDVYVVAGKPGVARGRIISDADDGSLALKATDLSIRTERAADDDGVWRSSDSARVREDLSFEIGGLVGLHAFDVQMANHPDWRLKSVWLRDEDITDRGVQFNPNDTVDGLTVVLTHAANELSGSVLSANGRRTPNAWVIVFPADPSLWRWPARWVRATLPDASGEYRVRQLPPSNAYLIAAVRYEAVEPGYWSDPEQLRALARVATRFALSPSEMKVLDVQVRP